jgi:hypothetical protein
VLEYSAGDEGVQCLAPRTRQRLVELICRHKGRLKRELEGVGGGNKTPRKVVKDAEWAAAVKKVIRIPVPGSLVSFQTRTGWILCIGGSCHENALYAGPYAGPVMRMPATQCMRITTVTQCMRMLLWKCLRHPTGICL